jgi:ABC-2 type transport system ATP-binding protein
VSALTIDHVSKSFDSVQAVNNLNLDIPEGAVFGLLGPNGAGKTTTIRMIMDIIIPDQGNIQIFGKPNSQEMRDQIGYLPEERGLYRKMKVRDILTFLAEMKGINGNESKKRIELWLERLDLQEWGDKKIEELSRGMQQKLQFIGTIIHEPRLIILDEPFTGLDPVNTDMIKDIILELNSKGTTIIFSTHLMEQVEKICKSICLINNGEAVLKGELKSIKKDFSKHAIRIAFEGKADFLDDAKLISAYDQKDSYYDVQLAEGVSTQQIIQSAVKHVQVSHFEILEPSLHDIFIETVTTSEGE